MRSYNRPEYLSKSLNIRKSDINMPVTKNIYMMINSNKPTIDILKKYEKDYEVIYNTKIKCVQWLFLNLI